MRFALVDRIDRLEIGKSAEGHRHISADDDYFRDHFPGYPVVPGVLLLESLAQLGGRLVGASVERASGRRVLPMLARVEHAKFVSPVKPGDRLDLRVELEAVTDDAARVRGVASVGAQKAAAAQIMFALVDLTGSGSPLEPAQASTLLQWSDSVWRRLTEPL